jgi:predicted O-methyltransferase YrrM
MSLQFPSALNTLLGVIRRGLPQQLRQQAFITRLRMLVFYRRWLSWRTLPWALHYLLFDRETTNFTYEIENRDELIAFVAAVLKVPLAEVAQYARELEDDHILRASLERRLRQRPDRNQQIYYARRLGWYTLVRLTKPAIVVETGVHDGLGTAVLARALQRNTQEGQTGTLFSFDIDPKAGWLLEPELSERAQVIIGDTRQTLAQQLTGRQVNMFIHDSDHSYEHELFELTTVADFMAPQGLLMSDNAHACDALKDFCQAQGLSFHFFQEKPARHFYPGGGIGLTIHPGARPTDQPVAVHNAPL